MLDAVAAADVVLDCSDRFATRHEVNRACVALGKPLVSGAAVRLDGQLSVFDVRRADSPCYACLYPDTTDFEEDRCATLGVFAPLVGIIGTMQAAEVIKLLVGFGEPLTGRLLTLDAREYGGDDTGDQTPARLCSLRRTPCAGGRCRCRNRRVATALRNNQLRPMACNA